MLARLLSHPSASTFDITAIVRLPEKAKQLETFGVKAVVGSTDDTALVEKLSEEAHVVFSCVSPCSHVTWVHPLTLMCPGQCRRPECHPGGSERFEEQTRQTWRPAYSHSYIWHWYVLDEVPALRVADQQIVGVLTKGFETKGMFATDKIYYDDDPADMASIPDDAPHRNVDLIVINADKEGLYIVLQQISS